jgi:hypothetical protein
MMSYFGRTAVKSEVRPPLEARCQPFPFLGPGAESSMGLFMELGEYLSQWMRLSLNGFLRTMQSPRCQ